jgi:hypothetical protein
VGDKVVGGVVGVKKGEHVLPLSMDFVCEAVREVAWGNGGICPLSKSNAFWFPGSHNSTQVYPTLHVKI